MVKLVVVCACLYAAYHFVGKSVGCAAVYGGCLAKGVDDAVARKTAARSVAFGIASAAFGFFAGYAAAGGVQ